MYNILMQQTTTATLIAGEVSLTQAWSAAIRLPMANGQTGRHKLWYFYVCVCVCVNARPACQANRRYGTMFLNTRRFHQHITKYVCA